VNVEYVKPVVDNFNDGDCVLVFDLELMLTPTLIGLPPTRYPHAHTHGSAASRLASTVRHAGASRLAS
jgi:hypothetical protein